MDAKQKRVVLVIVGAAVLFVVFSAAFKSSTPQTPGITPQSDSSPNQSPPPAPAAAQTPSATPVMPKMPAHLYAMEDDGEYGYEPALSENDRKQGTQAKALLMFRYLGEKDGTFTVQLKDGPASQIASCKEPCDFIKVKTLYAGEVVRTETLKSTGSALIDAVLQDARNGMLVLYKKKSS